MITFTVHIHSAVGVRGCMGGLQENGMWPSGYGAGLQAFRAFWPEGSWLHWEGHDDVPTKIPLRRINYDYHPLLVRPVQDSSSIDTSIHFHHRS